MPPPTLPKIKYSAPVQPWEITAGDDLVFTFRLKVDGAYTDFTGWQLSVNVRDTDTFEQKGSTLTIGSGIEISDYDYVDDLDAPQTAVNGQAVVTIPSSITEALRLVKVKSLSFDLETINPDGLKRTFVPSIITGTKDYTRA